MWCYLTLLVIVVAGLVSGKSAQKKQNSERDEGFESILNKPSGRAYNCGDPKTKLEATWSPTTISPRDSVIINASFVVPFDVEAAFLNITVWFYDQEIVPMLAYRHVVDSASLKEWHLDQMVKFPSKKNSFVSLTYRVSESMTAGLKGYTGKYIIQVEFKTFKGRQIICGRAVINVV